MHPIDLPETPFRPAVRSFVTRAGRIGSGQRRALDTLATRYLQPFEPAPLDAARAFGRAAPLVVEIGFGMGAATAAIAAARPASNFLAIEVHEAGIGALMKLLAERGLENVRIVRHDAIEVMARMIAPASVDAVHVFFPDPWPKRRHWKRRLIQPAFVSLLASRLVAGGRLHCATDWEPYARQMLAVLSAEPRLVNTAAHYAPRPETRPLTKFEARGLALGHGVRDLIFVAR